MLVGEDVAARVNDDSRAHAVDLLGFAGTFATGLVPFNVHHSRLGRRMARTVSVIREAEGVSASKLTGSELTLTPASRAAKAVDAERNRIFL